MSGKDEVEPIAKFPDFYYVAVALCNMVGHTFRVKDIINCDVDGDDDLIEGTVTFVLDKKKKESKEIRKIIKSRIKGESFGIKNNKYSFTLSGKDNVLYLSYYYKA